MAEAGITLSHVTQAKAKKELNECPEKRKFAIDAMHQLMTKNNIDFIRTDDAFLLRFLRARKFDVNKAFQLYVQYVEYRQKNKALFNCFNVSENGIKQAVLDGFPSVLPHTDDHGRRILILFTSNWDHYRYSLIPLYRALLLSLEVLLEDEETQVNGFVIIVDWTEFSFKQSSHLKPKLLRLIIEGLQDCFPARFSGIHFINQPWYVEAALTVIKPFLKDKNKNKIFMHGNNFTTLHKHIHPDILPAELGGSGPPYNNEYWAKQLIGAEAFSLDNKQTLWPENLKSNSLLMKHHSESCTKLHESAKENSSYTHADENFFLSE